MTIYDAAMRYAQEGVELLVLGGKEYGSGSSRDWAAKGTKLLGVRAVIVESFERIHRSNLIGMGVLPLQFPDGESAQSLGLSGEERFSIEGIADAVAAAQDGSPAQVRVSATQAGADGAPGVRFDARVADRHAARGRVLPPRRHPALRPAGAARPMSDPAAGDRAERAVADGVPKLLRELLMARGPSGYETAPAAVWREAASEFAQASIDVVGTPLALVAPREAGADERQPRLLVMGHIDEIGLIVTHIDDEGYLWFRGVGGWDAQVLVGQRVVLDTAAGPLPGVIGRKPIHLLRDEDAKKVAEIREMHIDIGARDGDQARELVRVGDVAVIDAEPAELANGRLTSRALDNRLGSYVALEAARSVAQAGGAAWELAAVAVAQEEITFGGSRTSAFALEPAAAIVVEVTHATDAPGIEVKESGKHELGSGPAIGRGAILNERLFELLSETAEAEQIPFTVEASARATGTDADAVHLSRGGVPTALVSIPIRYMHSPVELVQLDDVQACVQLVAKAALRLERASSF